MAIEKKTIGIKQLLFDPHNPRLPEAFGKDQRQIFRFLVDEIGIEDVLQSISSSGVIEGDPIIARPAEGKDEFYVIEGNRRLAALKLLNGEKIGDRNAEPTVPDVNPDVRGTLGSITIQLGWPEKELETYLGYKHVTATREWAPEAKARFVIERCKGDFSQDNLSKFAKRLGTNPPTLRRWMIAYLTLKQAEEAELFDPKIAYGKRYFGTFYTLLGSQQVQDFLGLKTEAVVYAPVPKKNLSNLAEFIAWTIGTKKAPPLVNSRMQQQLDAVLSSPPALQHFRSKRNLETALLYTEYNANEISEKLLSAAYTIEECLTKVFDVRTESNVVSAIETLDGAYKKLKINTATEPKTTKAQ